MVQYDPFRNARELKERNSQREQLLKERKKIKVDKQKLSKVDIHNKKLLKSQQDMIQALSETNYTLKRISLLLIISNVILILGTVYNFFF